jgi:hypothetical protein
LRRERPIAVWPIGIGEIEEDGTFRPEQVCRGTEDHAREEVAPFGQKDGDQKNR